MPQQTVEAFMREFFSARSRQIRSELEARAPFRERFFSRDCIWDSHSGAVENSESEKILTWSNSGARAEVVTKPADPHPRLRYHLSSEGQRWLIEHVELECLVCRQSSPNPNCPVCKGSGWHGAGNVHSHMEAELEPGLRKKERPLRRRRF